MKRVHVWIGRTPLAGAAAGAAVGVLACLVLGARGFLLDSFLIAAPALAGYSTGAAAAAARLRRADVDYVLRLREELRLSQNHIMENATLRSLGAYLDAAGEETRPALREAIEAAGRLAGDAGLPEGSRQAAAGLARRLRDLQDVLHHLAGFESTRPARAPFSVNTLLREAVLLCRHRAEERQIVLDERYGVVPPVFGPAGRVQQALHNILINSVEAMPHGGGTIVIETAHEGDRVVVRVRDAGTGIRPEHLPRIFDPFFTTKPERSGLGLGLWAARHAFDMVGADVEVKSAWLQGTELVVRFPQAAPVRAGREGEEHPQEIHENTAGEASRQIA